ncbi:MAG: hypothetical protein MSS16_09210 [Streptococcus orisratti]|uniref:hypothetical protein n=1 Tax=Streptococcus orisratti TaxID=114652 RepID=UPI0023577D70|nr:hypothetical protein [Streptococcus orisratti]MCI7678231.1 hypothetical protein [Streptococcus orisratti]
MKSLRKLHKICLGLAVVTLFAIAGVFVYRKFTVLEGTYTQYNVSKGYKASAKLVITEDDTASCVAKTEYSDSKKNGYARYTNGIVDRDKKQITFKGYTSKNWYSDDTGVLKYTNKVTFYYDKTGLERLSIKVKDGDNTSDIGEFVKE